MEEDYIYLDNASTTKVDDNVLKEMIPYMSDLYGNSSSSHSMGVKINKQVKLAREKVADLINSAPSDIVFTSGATESINTILKGVALSNKSDRNQIITLSTEHSAVLDTCKYLEQVGIDVVYLPVLPSGLVDVDLLRNAISDKTLLVCIMLVNNETGVIQPIKEITTISHEKGALMFTDATQAVGKIPVDINNLNIDFLAFSGHKFHAPKGVGGYYSNSKTTSSITPLLHGGGQEKSKRSGTLNVPGIIGVGKACEINRESIEQDEEYVRNLRDFLEAELTILDNVFVNGDTKNRIYNISNICFQEIEADILIKMLNNICITNGSACHSALIEPSHVLTSMGLTQQDAFSSVRFSLSKYNTKEEISFTIKKVKEIVDQLKN